MYFIPHISYSYFFWFVRLFFVTRSQCVRPMELIKGGFIVAMKKPFTSAYWSGFCLVAAWIEMLHNGSFHCFIYHYLLTKTTMSNQIITTLWVNCNYLVTIHISTNPVGSESRLSPKLVKTMSLGVPVPSLGHLFPKLEYWRPFEALTKKCENTKHISKILSHGW